VPVPTNCVWTVDTGVTEATFIMCMYLVPEASANTSACLPMMFHTLVWAARCVKFA
jgi:hypothetical protein